METRVIYTLDQLVMFGRSGHWKSQWSNIETVECSSCPAA
ncbi:hypothetical protein NK6_7986 [Bradyrhizobium diazoefficiens]|uniref:Uncharacterized protein n=1 Tax=Bradyrhizobium diazoefficiens TaxID=1355477 RepID=A0A0E4FWW7_9BRAD|nr:hypothetical protein NK6_7986 [Bradyrhizobium diazoefficiens]